MKVKNFKDLLVWQKAFELVIAIYKVTETFPKTEAYGLAQQIRRSSVSIPSNIAEGFRRQHNKEYRQFLYISLGSAGELETQIRIASHLGYLSQEAPLMINMIDEICAMLTGLIQRLNERGLLTTGH